MSDLSFQRYQEKAFPAGEGMTVSGSMLQRLVLWLTILGSCLVFIEPSPFEVLVVLAGVLFLATGLRFSAKFAPLLLMLCLFNLGGIISLVPWMHETRSVMFILISIYFIFVAVFFACLMLQDTLARIKVIENAWIVAGVLVSIIGAIGYFDIAGTSAIFTVNGRASATFKDPNVLGVFLAAPFVFLVMGFLYGGRRWLLLRLFAFACIAMGILLSFSRGAWIVAISAAGLAVLLSFVLSLSNRHRFRIILLSVVGFGLLVAGLIGALSIPQLNKLFLERASLSQSYDVGSGGRFDNQIKSIPRLIELPNGFGPYRFRYHFPEDPHNVYINAFASYGWLGGFSYLALALATIMIGWRMVLRQSSLQREKIAIWSVLFMLILQGVQIDTDHWRHFWILLGMVWGLYALENRRPSWHPQG
jgi:hypothetical protein